MNNLLATVVILLTVSTIQAETFSIDPTSGKDTVYFRSTAKLEFIEGKTNDIRGSLTFDPANLKEVSGTLQVDLRTLKTGIDTRDGHMRDRHLHTDKYPHAFFELTGVSGLPSELTTGTVHKGTAEGWFYIHGVKRKLEAPVEISHFTSSDEDAVMIRTSFVLKLDEYEIPRPKALFLKLAETIAVECIFTAYNNLPVRPVELPGWAEIQ